MKNLYVNMGQNIVLDSEYLWEQEICVIPGFTQRRATIAHRHFGTSYRSRLQGSKGQSRVNLLDFLNLENKKYKNKNEKVQCGANST
jgi:hypothetical protein